MRLNLGGEKNLSVKQYKLASLCAKLDSLSPLKVLARGYSITENEQGKVITEITHIRKGEQLRTRLSNGIIFSTVIKTEKIP